jgi:hypothetical protein
MKNYHTSYHVGDIVDFPQDQFTHITDPTWQTVPYPKTSAPTRGDMNLPPINVYTPPSCTLQDTIIAITLTLGSVATGCLLALLVYTLIIAR